MAAAFPPAAGPPAECATSAHVFAAMALDEILDDLSTRFIINVPGEETSSIERICFQIEQAHWFYEDFVREQNPRLASFSLKNFSALLFHHCPLLRQWSGREAEDAFRRFVKYKVRVPVCGAIVLNETLDKVLLVKGWTARSTWTFPKGKINKDEPESECAAREVFEETGCDVSAGIAQRPDDHIELSLQGQRIRMYIVPFVPESFAFCPRTRKEISALAWFPLVALPAFRSPSAQPAAATAAARKKQQRHTPTLARFEIVGTGNAVVDTASDEQLRAAIEERLFLRGNSLRFYHVAPFSAHLKRWLKTTGKALLKSRVAPHVPLGVAAPDPEPEPEPEPMLLYGNLGPDRAHDMSEVSSALKSLLGISCAPAIVTADPAAQPAKTPASRSVSQIAALNAPPSSSQSSGSAFSALLADALAGKAAARTSMPPKSSTNGTLSTTASSSTSSTSLLDLVRYGPSAAAPAAPSAPMGLHGAAAFPDNDEKLTSHVPASRRSSLAVSNGSQGLLDLFTRGAPDPVRRDNNGLLALIKGDPGTGTGLLSQLVSGGESVDYAQWASPSKVAGTSASAAANPAVVPSQSCGGLLGQLISGSSVNVPPAPGPSVASGGLLGLLRGDSSSSSGVPPPASTVVSGGLLGLLRGNAAPEAPPAHSLPAPPVSGTVSEQPSLLALLKQPPAAVPPASEQPSTSPLAGFQLNVNTLLQAFESAPAPKRPSGR